MKPLNDKMTYSLDRLCVGDPFFDECLEFVYNLLKNESVISEICIEPVVSYTTKEFKKSVSCSSVLTLSHDKTASDQVELVWIEKKKILIVSCRLLLALYLLVKDFIRHSSSILGNTRIHPSNGMISNYKPFFNLITFIGLLINPQNVQVLTLRAALFETANMSVLETELTRSQAFLHIYPKTHSLWMYRRFLLNRCIPFATDLINKETSLMLLEVQRTPFIYYPWVHWLWMSKTFPNSNFSNMYKTEEETQSFFKKCIGLTPYYYGPYYHFYNWLVGHESLNEPTQRFLIDFITLLVTLYEDSQALHLFVNLLYLRYYTLPIGSTLHNLLELPSLKKYKPCFKLCS